MVSSHLTDVAMDTDYEAMRIFNEKFDDLDDLEAEWAENEETRCERFQKAFAGFFEEHRSKIAEVDERVEEETAGLIGPYVIKRIER